MVAAHAHLKRGRRTPRRRTLLAEVVPDRQIQAWTVISLRISGATDKASALEKRQRRLKLRQRTVKEVLGP